MPPPSLALRNPISRIPRPRPSFSQLGLHRLGGFLLAANAIVLLIDILLFRATGLSAQWSTVSVGEFGLVALLVVWLNFYFVPGHPKEWFAAEVVFIVGLMVLVTVLGSPMQYGAVAIGAPYADPWLAAADAAIGVHVPALVAWTAAHGLNRFFTVVYFSFIPQFFFAILVLSLYRDRARVWELAFNFHVCAIVTVAALILCPAICAPMYYQFEPTINITREVGQIQGYHDGTLRVVRFDQLEGLVSFPSFHVTGALIVTWAFRHRRRFFVPLVLLNVALIASTVMTGLHYMIDVIAAGPLVALSVFAYSRLESRWLPSELPDRPPVSALPAFSPVGAASTPDRSWDASSSPIS